MTNHDTDHTLLIAEYTLGVLSHAETAQVQRLLGSNPQALVDALKWEQALLELTDLLPPAQLSDSLWEEIALSLGIDASAIAAYPLPLRPENSLENHTTLTPPEIVAAPVAPATQTKSAVTAPLTPATQPPVISQTDSSPAVAPTQTGRWRLQPKHIGLVAVLFAIALLASRLIPGTPAAPPVTVLQVAPTQAAILQAPGNSSTPGWVVTITPQGDVLLHPRVQTQIPEQASVQLWTYSLSQAEPRSLGLIDPNLPVTVPANLMGTIAPDQIFEMTQEPLGGSVSSGPSGPVLFIGHVVTFEQPLTAPLATPHNSANL